MGRAISEQFKKDLMVGCLKGLLEEVKNDNTLIMELRGNFVVIYYRGGALFTIASTENGDYNISYNSAYWRIKKKYNEIVENPTIDECIRYIALYKNQMDYHRANADRELEKQGQQRLILENNVLGGKNYADLSDKTQISTGDYFIIDMEYAYKNAGIDARFDAIGLKWPSLGSIRKKGRNLGIAFIELKYYDNAMGGTSGIVKHISDFIKFTNTDKYKEDYHKMCADMSIVFRQKCELGLIPSYTSRLDMTQDRYLDVSIDPNSVEMIFIFLNRDPDSTVAAKKLDKCLKKYGLEKMKNIYVATSSDMGYIMFRYSDKGKTDRYIPIQKYAEAYGYKYDNE